jgi:hypothetical protein
MTFPSSSPSKCLKNRVEMLMGDDVKILSYFSGKELVL